MHPLKKGLARLLLDEQPSTYSGNACKYWTDENGVNRRALVGVLHPISTLRGLPWCLREPRIREARVLHDLPEERRRSRLFRWLTE
jgi:hypothetical protein